MLNLAHVRKLSRVFDRRRRAALLRSALVEDVTGPRPDVETATSGGVLGLVKGHQARPMAMEKRRPDLRVVRGWAAAT